MFDDHKRTLVRALIYPVQFDSQPAASVGRILELYSGEQLPPGSLDEYLEAINSALESKQELSKLVPQNHREEVIRSYLTKIHQALKTAAVGA